MKIGTNAQDERGLKNKCPRSFKEEMRLWRQGYEFVAGLDEAGRGPLAGPVVAAAVCFRAQKSAAISLKLKIENLELRDSKKLSARQREKWYAILTRHPDIKWGVGIVSQKIIDKINILEATKMAMKQALENLKINPDYLLLDGNFLLDNLDIGQKAVIRGDEKIVSCATASIIAKVSRDRLMVRYHQKYPAYSFDKHKGYGTKGHFAAIKKYGPSAIHRRSFALGGQK